MPLQFSTAARNAMLDAIATILGNSEVLKIFTGVVPANCAAADSGTKLVEYDLAASNDWAAAVAAAKTLNSLPLVANAVALGTAGYFRFYDSLAACHMQGTITVEMTIDNVLIASGQEVRVTGFTLTAPGA